MCGGANSGEMTASKSGNVSEEELLEQEDEHKLKS